MAKATTGKRAEVIDVPAPGQQELDVQTGGELEQVQSAGLMVVEFMRGVKKFFTTAAALEQQAAQTLATAKAMKLPTSKDEDAKLQRFVLETRQQTKVVEEHWKITTAISGFHRRMTAARKRSTDALDGALLLGTNLHNSYEAAERRRAAEEQERIRLANEREAQAQRDRELAEAEERAVALEEASDDLSERELTFVNLYTGNNSSYAGKGQPSAQRAGYKDAVKTAARLLSLKKIQDAIKGKLEAQALRQQADAKKAAPLVYDEPEVQAQVATVATSVTTWRGEVLDQNKLMDAFLANTHGIPRDIWVVDQVALNKHAQALHEKMDYWPGARAVSKTGLR